MKDGQGLDVANADAKAIEALDVLREEWLAFGNRFEPFIAAADAEQKCALLPALAATLALSANTSEGRARGARLFARAQAMSAGAGPREQAWLDATQAWLDGSTDRSLALHEKIVGDWPRDLLAGRVGQILALAIGDGEALLRIGERLVDAAPNGRFVHGLYAVGLAESHRLEEAEAEARKAIEIERTDAGAHHALTHCFAARGRLAEGVAFLEATGAAWPPGGWHLALFLIDLDRLSEALALADARVERTEVISLLARLELRGIDVGARWADVAPTVTDAPGAPVLDLHILYALARAGRQSAVTEMLASLEDRAERARPFEREAWADAAVPAAHGLAAHARGEHAEAARLLSQAMPHLRMIGGSTLQRALFGAIHLDALIKSGWNDAALKILQADERERPAVPATKRALADLYRKLGRAEQAMAADYQAERLTRQYADPVVLSSAKDLTSATQSLVAPLDPSLRSG